MDPECIVVLQRRFPGVSIARDVRELHPPAADFVTGGWPCQDLSVAGLRRGLRGERSGLFFEMVRVAIEAGAHTIVAENVPNLLRLDGGENFDLVLKSFEQAGYPYVAWRLLNARSFGLPHDRKRVFIIATKHREVAMALHRRLPPQGSAADGASPETVAGFYWTAGIQSICYSPGFVPTLKVGSSLSIASPPAVHFDDVVRLLRPAEALRLQGFGPGEFEGVPARAVFRMAGNAVAATVGRWVVDSLRAPATDPPTFSGFGYTGPAGLYENGTKHLAEEPPPSLAADLPRFIDLEDRVTISVRAAAGLLRRLERSGKPCPVKLREDLRGIARSGTTWSHPEEEDFAPDDGSTDDSLEGDHVTPLPSRPQLGLFEGA
jgi:DNA (cytosine-5)-methyltransferase 1